MIPITSFTDDEILKLAGVAPATGIESLSDDEVLRMAGVQPQPVQQPAPTPAQQPATLADTYAQNQSSTSAVPYNEALDTPEAINFMPDASNYVGAYEPKAGQKKSYPQEFSDALMRGSGGLVEGAANVAAWGGKVIGSDTIQQKAGAIADEFKESAKSFAPTVDGMYSINNADDAARWVISLIGENAPNMGAMAATAKVLAPKILGAMESFGAGNVMEKLAVNSPSIYKAIEKAKILPTTTEGIAEAAGAAAASVPMELGAIYGRQREASARTGNDTNAWGALAMAVPAGFLDAIGIENLMKATRIVGKEATEGIVKRLWTGFKQGAIGEMPTEGLQSVFERGGEAMIDPKVKMLSKDAFAEYLENAVAGGLTGGIFGGAGRMVRQQSTDPHQPKPDQQQPQPPTPTPTRDDLQSVMPENQDEIDELIAAYGAGKDSAPPSPAPVSPQNQLQNAYVAPTATPEQVVQSSQTAQQVQQAPPAQSPITSNVQAPTNTGIAEPIQQVPASVQAPQQPIVTEPIPQVGANTPQEVADATQKTERLLNPPDVSTSGAGQVEMPAPVSQQVQTVTAMKPQAPQAKKALPDIRTFFINSGGISLPIESKGGYSGELRKLREEMGKWEGNRLVRTLKVGGAVSLDDALTRAKEAGYLSEDATLDDLIEALREKRPHPVTAEDEQSKLLDIENERRENIALRRRIERNISRLKKDDPTLTYDELRELSFIDKDTGLPNKLAYERDLDKNMDGVTVAIDMNGLKYVNDTFGHGAGDDFIRHFAAVMQTELGSHFYRIGGDEFSAIFPNLKDAHDAMDTLQEVVKELQFEITANDGTVLVVKGVTYSYGTGQGRNAKEHKESSDADLYRDKVRAKARGDRPSEPGAKPPRLSVREAGRRDNIDPFEDNSGANAGTETAPGEDISQSENIALVSPDAPAPPKKATQPDMLGAPEPEKSAIISPMTPSKGAGDISTKTTPQPEGGNWQDTSKWDIPKFEARPKDSADALSWIEVAPEQDIANQEWAYRKKRLSSYRAPEPGKFGTKENVIEIARAIKALAEGKIYASEFQEILTKNLPQHSQDVHLEDVAGAMTVYDTLWDAYMKQMPDTAKIILPGGYEYKVNNFPFTIEQLAMHSPEYAIDIARRFYEAPHLLIAELRKSEGEIARLNEEDLRFIAKAYFKKPMETYQIPLNDFLASRPITGVGTTGGAALRSESGARILHKNAVVQALKEGKSVPPEVLKDYPDLNKPIRTPSEGVQDVLTNPEKESPKSKATQSDMFGAKTGLEGPVRAESVDLTKDNLFTRADTVQAEKNAKEDAERQASLYDEIGHKPDTISEEATPYEAKGTAKEETQVISELPYDSGKAHTVTAKAGKDAISISAGKRAVNIPVIRKQVGTESGMYYILGDREGKTFALKTSLVNFGTVAINFARNGYDNLRATPEIVSRGEDITNLSDDEGKFLYSGIHVPTMIDQIRTTLSKSRDADGNIFYEGIRESDLKALEEVWNLPNWIAQDYPEFMQHKQIEVDRQENREALLHEMLQSPTKKRAGEHHEFLSLSKEDEAVVAKLIVESDADNRLMSRKELEERGITTPQMIAYYAWKRSMDKALELRIENYKKVSLIPYEDRTYYDQLKEIMDMDATGLEVRKRVLDLAGQMPQMNRDAFMADVDSLIPDKGSIKELRAQLEGLNFYMPRTRGQGEYVARVRDENGNVIWSERTTSNPKGGALVKIGRALRMNEAKKIEKRLRAEFPDGRIEWKHEPHTPEFMYQEMSDAAIERFLDKTIEKVRDGGKISNTELSAVKDAIKQTLVDELKARGFGKHAIHRKQGAPIGGYKTEGLKQVFVDYMSGASGFMSKSEAAMRHHLALQNLPNNKPKLMQYAQKYVKDMMRNQTKIDRVSGRLRAMAYTWYLMGNIRFAAVQMTQNYVAAIPELATHTKGAHRKYHLAMLQVASGQGLTTEEKAALDKAYNAGITKDQYLREVTARIHGGPRSAWRKTIDALSIPFRGMEIFNRKSSFLAAWRVAKYEKKMSSDDAYDFARQFVDNTQFWMSKANLPGWARGEGAASGIARTLYTFKSFQQNYMLLLRKWAKQGPDGYRAIAYSMAWLAAFGGAGAVPFLDDILDLLEQITGYPARKIVKDRLKKYGDVVAKIGTQGIPALIGIDLSGSLKMEVPFLKAASSALTLGQVNAGGGASDVWGVYSGLGQKAAKGVHFVSQKEMYRAAEQLAPVFIENAMKGYRQMSGPVLDDKGRPMFDERTGKPFVLSTAEGIGQMAGFRPARTADISKEKRMAQNLDGYFDRRRADITEAYRYAAQAKDKDAIRKVMDDIKEYNKDAMKYPKVAAPITGQTLQRALKPKQNKAVRAFLGLDTAD